MDFYNEFKKGLEMTSSGLLVEIGSGSGFLKDLIPALITTDVFNCDGIDVVLDGEKLPFENCSVSVFFMQNVLHHIKNPIPFLKEVNRCLIDNGKIIMIEPYNSLWSSFIYKNFHHERFDTKADWKTEGSGRLSDANGALPWIIFCRDYERFVKEFPQLKIVKLIPHTPFLYIISGGLSMKQLLPDFTYDLIKVIEKFLSPFNKYIGMFFTIELQKKS